MSDKKINEGRTQVKRKYGEHSSIRVNEKTPVRNKVIEFVGKRFVTETEMKTFLTQLTESRGKELNQKQWFDRNKRFFESFENRGQKVITLSKYGKRVLEMIAKSAQKQTINESIGLFKSEIFESIESNESLNEGVSINNLEDYRFGDHTGYFGVGDDEAAQKDLAKFLGVASIEDCYSFGGEVEDEDSQQLYSDYNEGPQGEFNQHMFFKYRTAGNDNVPSSFKPSGMGHITVGATKGEVFSGNDHGMEYVWVPKKVVMQELKDF
jgi:hypothetical protein